MRTASSPFDDTDRRCVRWRTEGPGFERARSDLEESAGVFPDGAELKTIVSPSRHEAGVEDGLRLEGLHGEAQRRDRRCSGCPSDGNAAAERGNHERAGEHGAKPDRRLDGTARDAAPTTHGVPDNASRANATSRAD